MAAAKINGTGQLVIGIGISKDLIVRRLSILQLQLYISLEICMEINYCGTPSCSLGALTETMRLLKY